MPDHKASDAHLREQAEAAFANVVEILQRHSDNFVVCVRTGPGIYARHINGRTQVERIAIASGVLGDLNLILSDIALVAAREVDVLDEQERRENREGTDA